MASLIRVYLDSSDYANLAIAKPATDLWHLRRHLARLVGDRTIEIGMSYFNVFELLQDHAPEFKQNRLERAELLRELCEANAFPYISDLRTWAGFCKGAIWLPAEVAAILDIKTVGDSALANIKKNPTLNRAARRRLSNVKRLAEFLREHPNYLANLDAQDWPFPKECLEPHFLRRYLLGELSRTQANAILLSLVCNPVSLLEMWFCHYKEANPLTKFAHETAATLRESINKLRLAMTEADKQTKKLRSLLRESHKLPNPSMQKAMRDVLHRPLEFDPQNPGPDFFFDKIPLLRERLPEAQGRLLSAALIALVLRDREFQDSDLVDVMHLAYLPLCDLWRGDKAFCDALKRAKVAGHERIVPKLMQLPDRIDQLLQKAA